MTKVKALGATFIGVFLSDIALRLNIAYLSGIGVVGSPQVLHRRQ
jgi:hypothetical protein